MIRKLASIKKIETLPPHPNADKLDIAYIGGWRAVVKKSEFNEGDLVVYCEIDSHIPLKLAPFLEKSNKVRTVNGVDGVVLKSIRLRGELSQGLILPLSVLSTDIIPVEGLDVSEDLNITKWEPPQPALLSGVTKGPFPSFIRKTDQSRIQNIWEELSNPDNNYIDNQWEVTTKLDGSSMTVYLNDGEFGVCSRNQELRETEDNTFWKVARQNNMEKKLRSLGRNIALQGELIGEGIQGNHEKIKGHEFYLYDIYLIDEGRHATVDERTSISFHLNYNIMDSHIEWVPSLGIMGFDFTNISLEDFMDHCDSLDGGVSLKAKTREGVVFKATKVNKLNEVESFKVISNNYLL